MNRNKQLERILKRSTPWDVLVIGGGATGVMIALDAATRGLEVLLLEQSDFGKGTSSRSTKLVHGGVRYLRQGNITLVRDALAERSLLRHNAPHLVHSMPFLIPCRNLWQRIFYGFGLRVYDLLAWSDEFASTQNVSKTESLQAIPTLQPQIVAGGVIYHDGQFDDSRLLINMAQTACEFGGCLVNYCRVDEISRSGSGKIDGVRATDQESGTSYSIATKSIVNAAGPFCDQVRRLDDPNCSSMISASQGIHLVLPRSFFPGDIAMMVPKTPDGRVLFFIPWHDHAIVGTTDTPIDVISLEPRAQVQEIAFLLSLASDYLSRPPQVSDVLSVFTGIRPLVKGDKSARTASLSRDHVIHLSDSGLVTITGGKWTTVRKMAEDCVDRLIKAFQMEAQPCKTKTLPIHGHLSPLKPSPRSYYGSDLDAIEQLEAESPELSEPLHPAISVRVSDVVWTVRHEMARTVEDVLARRTRALFLNARAAQQIAPRVAAIIAKERGLEDPWIDEQIRSFRELANLYVVDPSTLNDR